MKYEDIKLNDLSKSFEFECICRELDNLDAESAKNYCKLFVKLYLLQQEVLSNLGHS